MIANAYIRVIFNANTTFHTMTHFTRIFFKAT